MGSNSSAPAAGRDEGQALPLMAVVLMVAAVAVLLAAHLGGVVVDRARARTAADAAALAGVDRRPARR